MNITVSIVITVTIALISYCNCNIDVYDVKPDNRIAWLILDSFHEPQSLEELKLILTTGHELCKRDRSIIYNLCDIKPLYSNETLKFLLKDVNDICISDTEDINDTFLSLLKVFNKDLENFIILFSSLIVSEDTLSFLHMLCEIKPKYSELSLEILLQNKGYNELCMTFH